MWGMWETFMEWPLEQARELGVGEGDIFSLVSGALGIGYKHTSCLEAICHTASARVAWSPS